MKKKYQLTSTRTIDLEEPLEGEIWVRRQHGREIHRMSLEVFEKGSKDGQIWKGYVRLEEVPQ